MNRRDFLKRSAVGLAGAALVGPSLHTLTQFAERQSIQAGHWVVWNGGRWALLSAGMTGHVGVVESVNPLRVVTDGRVMARVESVVVEEQWGWFVLNQPTVS